MIVRCRSILEECAGHMQPGWRPLLVLCSEPGKSHSTRKTAAHCAGSSRLQVPYDTASNQRKGHSCVARRGDLRLRTSCTLYASPCDSISEVKSSECTTVISRRRRPASRSPQESQPAHPSARRHLYRRAHHAIAPSSAEDYRVPVPGMHEGHPCRNRRR